MDEVDEVLGGRSEARWEEGSQVPEELFPGDAHLVRGFGEVGAKAEDGRLECG